MLIIKGVGGGMVLAGGFVEQSYGVLGYGVGSNKALGSLGYGVGSNKALGSLGYGVGSNKALGSLGYGVMISELGYGSAYDITLV